MAAPYEAGSIVIMMIRVFMEWGAIFTVDNILVTTLFDRLMHYEEAAVSNERISYMRYR